MFDHVNINFNDMFEFRILHIPEGTSINYLKGVTQVAFVYLSTLNEL